MEIAIIGPGGLGCLFAVFLARSGHNVSILDRNPERAAHINSQGIIYLEGSTRERVDSILVTADARVVGQADLLLLCVKSHDTESAVQRISAFVKPSTLLLAFQNGIGHHRVLGRQLKLWGLAVTAMGASMVGAGQVRFGGNGLTSLGFGSKVGIEQRAELKQVSTLFNEAGLAAQVSDDILAAVWRKLIVNVGINALTALHNCANGELLKYPHILETQERAVLEAVAVAQAKGIDIGGDPVDMVRQVCGSTCGNISSMLQDVRLGRQTEIEAINGAVVKEAAALQIDAPVNNALYAAVKELEQKIE